jgi:RsiW-degrading membrane proteinase PrsW (M82 family)
VNEALIKAASLVLAWGFSGVVAYLLLALADGWASRTAFGKGAVLALLSIVLALPISLVLNAELHRFEEPLAAAALHAFFSAALCEEGGRLIALLILMRMTITRDPREFFIGTVAIGLGFGIVENLFYLKASQTPLLVGALRGIMTAPAHLSFALVLGFGVWRYLRERAPVLVLVTMFLIAVMMHGTYDFAAMAWPNTEKWQTSPLSTPTLIGLAILMIVTVAMLGLAALMMVDEFLWRIEGAPPHDPALSLRAPLSPRWNLLGWALALIGLLLGVGAVAAIAFAKPIALPVLPIAIAAAVSTSFWGFSVIQLANRQRMTAHEARIFATVPRRFTAAQ